MKWREFLASKLLGYEPQPKPPKPRYWHPVDPTELLRHDAAILLRRIWEDRPSSRADMIASGRMTYSRWTQAYRLLRSLEIIDKYREINTRRVPNFVVADMLLRDGIKRREAVRAAGRFVAARKGERG